MSDAVFDQVAERSDQMHDAALRHNLPELRPHIVVFSPHGWCDMRKSYKWTEALNTGLGRRGWTDWQTFDGAAILIDHRTREKWAVMDAEAADPWLREAERVDVARAGLRARLVGRYRGRYRKPTRPSIAGVYSDVV
jgi:hypothetical protein